MPIIKRILNNCGGRCRNNAGGVITADDTKQVPPQFMAVYTTACVIWWREKTHKPSPRITMYHDKGEPPLLHHRPHILPPNYYPV